MSTPLDMADAATAPQGVSRESVETSSPQSHPNPTFDPSSHPPTDAHYPLLGSGRPYNYFTPFILTEADKTEPLLMAFNGSTPGADRDEKLRALIGRVGKGAMVIPPLFVEWGSHTSLGAGSYLGTGVKIQDTGGVTIRDNAMIGPSCTITTVTHPLNPRLRGPHSPELSRPVNIGANVWLGANVTVLGGVDIGEGCVIGAGAVVTRSTGKNELWVGVPARKIRERLDECEDGIDWDSVPPV